ncbi:glycosyltransferase family 2 protein [Leptothoe sp. PORK10 BA2]|uniref:glycosyltransferase family 2 protein n=1 Tax=Leptothoe sp. PORK10 BA2 TaxID=3110254 RepID=UPI002B211E8E|nr:glycosyltransferase [Leptothoe sp. PORK10 BA2]MEA5465664.1 glycosyltransferase [Leptothoe sp. PORK10 BA2]
MTTLIFGENKTVTKVSVIIPAYNSMAFLPKTLNSVLGQTYADFEVLIINDGSTDHITDWAAGLTDSRIKLINQENQGCATARNAGVLASNGQYIAFLDADDLWEPTKLEQQVYILDTFLNVGLVNTWISNIDDEGISIGKIGISNAEGHVWESVIEENPIMCGSTPMVRRQCFESVGLFDQNLRSAEDWDMWIRIAEKYEFAVIKEPLVRYRIHANSKSHNLQLHLQGRLKVIEKAFQNSEIDGTAMKDKAYGLAYLSVAYRALQNYDLDAAHALKEKSLRYYPALFNSKVFHRLGLILFLRRRLGDRLYQQFISGFQQISKFSIWPQNKLIQQ